MQDRWRDDVVGARPPLNSVREVEEESERVAVAQVAAARGRYAAMEEKKSEAAVPTHVMKIVTP